MGPIAALAGASAMMDVSDGVVLDATRMARASGVSVRLDSSLPWSGHSLFGGEDHGLLACFPNDQAVPQGFSVLGEIVDHREGHPVILDGWDLQESLGGWDPFTA
jgi:thiamine-monophosphate kinase